MRLSPEESKVITAKSRKRIFDNFSIIQTVRAWKNIYNNKNYQTSSDA